MGNKIEITTSKNTTAQDITLHKTHRLAFQARIFSREAQQELQQELQQEPPPIYDFPQLTEYTRTQIYPLDTFLDSPLSPEEKIEILGHDKHTYIFYDIKKMALQSLRCACLANKNHYEVDWYISGQRDPVKTVQILNLTSKS